MRILLSSIPGFWHICSSAASAYLRGALVSAGADVEQCDESDRCSTDEFRKALCVLGLSGSSIPERPFLQTAFCNREVVAIVIVIVVVVVVVVVAVLVVW